jgi:hypothetical protein
MNPDKKELYTAKRSSNLNTADVATELAPLVERLKAEDGDVNWLLLTVSATTNALEINSSGGGGLDELQTNLSDDLILYGVFKGRIAGQAKYFHLYFVGASVGAMKKGKGSLNKNAIFQLVEAHGQVECAMGAEMFSREFVVSELSSRTKCPADQIELP